MDKKQAQEILRNYDDLVWQRDNNISQLDITEALWIAEEALSEPWISVNDRLPKDGQFILMLKQNGLVEPIYYPEPNITDDMVYWVEIPELPKIEK